MMCFGIPEIREEAKRHRPHSKAGELGDHQGNRGKQLGQAKLIGLEDMRIQPDYIDKAENHANVGDNGVAQALFDYDSHRFLFMSGVIFVPPVIMFIQFANRIARLMRVI